MRKLEEPRSRGPTTMTISLLMLTRSYRCTLLEACLTNALLLSPLAI